jgi:hypothetical protein
MEVVSYQVEDSSCGGSTAGVGEATTSLHDGHDELGSVLDGRSVSNVKKKMEGGAFPGKSLFADSQGTSVIPE